MTEEFDKARRDNFLGVRELHSQTRPTGEPLVGEGVHVLLILNLLLTAV
jgi:hypothetical protein